MPSTSPRVSIAMPVYNGAATIGAAIESALAQTYEDFELVIVDNASTDGTVAIVEGYDDPRIRLEHNPATVPFADNHNRSMLHSRADLIKPLHADDRLLPACLERMVPLFDAHPDVALVFAPRETEVTGERDAEMEWWLREFADPHLKFEGLREVNDGRDLLRQYLEAGLGENWVGEPSAVMVRRSALRRIGLYSSYVMSMNDMDMNLRVMALFDIGFVDEPLSVYVRHRGSLVDSLNRVDWLDRLWMLEGLVGDAQMRSRAPGVLGGRTRERRRVARLLVRVARRRRRELPERLRQLGVYGRYVALARAGRAPALHPALEPPQD